MSAEAKDVEGQLLPARPVAFDSKVAAIIVERITSGEAVIGICRDQSMPSISTIYEWIRSNETFAKDYARAKQDYAEYIVEEVLEISDDARNDWMLRNDPDNPGFVLMGENIQRAKLRVDSRKWAAAHLKPKIYGDATRHEHTGEGGGPILIAPARRTEIFARMIEHTGAEPKPDDGK